MFTISLAIIIGLFVISYSIDQLTKVMHKIAKAKESIAETQRMKETRKNNIKSKIL